MPAYNAKFFRVANPKEPKLPATDLYNMVPFNQKASRR
jgi:glutaconyl-CoA decarboxylase